MRPGQYLADSRFQTVDLVSDLVGHRVAELLEEGQQLFATVELHRQRIQIPSVEVTARRPTT